MSKIKKCGANLSFNLFYMANLLVLICGALCFAIGAYFWGATLNQISPVENHTAKWMLISGTLAVAYGCFDAFCARPCKKHGGRWITAFSLMFVAAAIVFAIIYLLQLINIKEVDIQKLVKRTWADEAGKEEVTVSLENLQSNTDDILISKTT